MSSSGRGNLFYLVSLLTAVLLAAVFGLPDARPGSVPGAALEEEQAGLGPPDLDCELDRILEPQFPPILGDDVLEIQERLKELGYYTGPLDGSYTDATVESVRRWHRDHGLGDSPVVDAATWESLTGPTAAAKYSEAVKAPPSGAKPSISIDVYRKKLSVYFDGFLYKEYPVSTGRSQTPTPVGDWKIADKGVNWGGGFGTRWLGFNVPWGLYGIHGTNKPWSIGRAASHGCIRMRNRDVEELYPLIPIGTPVKIIGEPVKWTIPRRMGAGSSGREVAILQNRLTRYGFDTISVDGRLGPNTVKAIAEIEHFFGFMPDGVAGPNLQIILGIR